MNCGIVPEFFSVDAAIIKIKSPLIEQFHLHPQGHRFVLQDTQPKIQLLILLITYASNGRKMQDLAS